MEKLGYEKVARLSLIGFVVLTMIILTLINIYFRRDSIYLSQQEDIEITKRIMEEAGQITQLLREFD